MMNANRLYIAAALLSTFLLPTTGQAQAASAPALYGVGEIQVQNARLGNSEATANCGMSSGEISNAVIKAFSGDLLPVFSPLNAPPEKESVARIDLLPTVMSMQTDDKTCTSWVSFSAQSHNPVVLTPIETPRYITVSYWDGGMLVHSTKGGHAQTLINAIDKIVGQFMRQYKLDQPPSLTPPTEVKKTP